jgi:hypothetical protein
MWFIIRTYNQTETLPGEKLPVSVADCQHRAAAEGLRASPSERWLLTEPQSDTICEYKWP